MLKTEVLVSLKPDQNNKFTSMTVCAYLLCKRKTRGKDSRLIVRKAPQER